MLKSLIFATALITFASHAMIESDLQTRFATDVESYFKQGATDTGTFHGKGEVPISYQVFEVQNEVGALVILPGRGEPLHKYAELVYDLRDLGYSMYLMSHRGQGESGRVNACTIQYVDDYDDYVDDVSTFMQTIIEPARHAHVVLLGHSMGAAIGTLYGLKHPGVLAGLILSAPMFDMNTKPYPKIMARSLAKAMVALGFGSSKAGTDSLKTTSSPTREALNNTITASHSSIQAKDISFAWGKASLDAIERIQTSDLSLLPVTLLLQAGADRHSPARGQNMVCDRIPSCTKLTFEGSLHELLMERDEIRDHALDVMREFLNRPKRFK